jgi:hypothetical protein
MNSPIIWSPGVKLEDIEEQVIKKAFKFYQGNKTSTANALGIAIRTLDTKLEKYESDAKARTKLDAERRAKDLDFLNRQRGPAQSYNESAEEKERQRASVLPSADAGARLESAGKISAEQAVPLPKPQEIQKVLPPQVAAGGARRAR